MSAAIVRPAIPRERFAVVALARDFHAVAGIPFPFCPAYFSGVAQDHIESPRKLCLILEVGGVASGVLMASTHMMPIAPVRAAQELIFWIAPGARGRSAGLMLAAYEAWAIAEGCAAIGLAGLNDRRVARLFRRAGFDLVENKFLKMVG